MLTAILQGKAGRISIDQKDSVSWRVLFSQSEDLLTATFFERFAYLSTDIQYKLLAACLKVPPEQLSSWAGPFESLDFWPGLSIANDVQRRVEPDLIIHFEKLDILIEAKRPYDSIQTKEQWQRELRAYLQNDDYHRKKSLCFIALGGENRTEVVTWLAELKQSHEFAVVLQDAAALGWQCLTDILLDLLSNADLRDLRILNDLLNALELFGLRTSRFHWSQLSTAILPPLSLISTSAAFQGMHHAGSPHNSFVLSDLFTTPLPILSLPATAEWRWS